MSDNGDDEQVTFTQPELVRILVSPMMWALEHFVHMDQANAAMHCAVVRFSPITFRLAEALDKLWVSNELIDLVLGHAGQYEEDKGR